MFIAAICLSIIAGYYSVVGMTSIFSGSMVAIILMSGTLEASKVIVASWLYNNWKNTPVLLKTYLTAAVVVLMFITSMGIFGFLSKAHIEQTGNAAQYQAQLVQIKSQITQTADDINKTQTKIDALSSQDQTTFESVQNQIDKEQTNIDKVYSRIQPDIDRVQTVIDDATKQRDAILETVANIDSLITSKNIAQVQKLIGVKADGRLGPATRDSIAAFKLKSAADVDRLNTIISDNVAKINELRKSVDPLVAESNALIKQLRSKITVTVSNTDTTAIDSQVKQLQSDLDNLNTKKSKLSDDQYQLENKIRLFEVEVGPIKYISQLIYGDIVDNTLLERSVRYMIMTLIFVFDPLAVLMLIASNQSMAQIKESKKSILPQVNHNTDATVIESVTVNAAQDHTEEPTVEIVSPQVTELKKKVSRSTKIKDKVQVVNTPDQQNFVDTAPDVLFNTINDTEDTDKTTNMINTTVEDTNNIGQVQDTEDLLNKLQQVHAARLQKYNANSLT